MEDGHIEICFRQKAEDTWEFNATLEELVDIINAMRRIREQREKSRKTAKGVKGNLKPLLRGTIDLIKGRTPVIAINDTSRIIEVKQTQEEK